MVASASVLQCWSLTDGSAPDWTPLRRLLEGVLDKRLEAAHAMPPGTLVKAGEPVWQLNLRHSASEADRLALQEAMRTSELAMGLRAADRMVQVYRQVDEAGRLRGDALRWLDDEPMPGMVLLVSVWAQGGWQAMMPSAGDAAQLYARHRAALPQDGAALVVMDDREQPGSVA